MKVIVGFLFVFFSFSFSSLYAQSNKSTAPILQGEINEQEDVLEKNAVLTKEKASQMAKNKEALKEDQRLKAEKGAAMNGVFYNKSVPKKELEDELKMKVFIEEKKKVVK